MEIKKLSKIKKPFKKNKKGIFFTSMVLVVLTLFLISYTFFSVIEDRKSLHKRIETMNSFVNSIELDIQRQLYISGFQMTFYIVEDAIINGLYDENNTTTQVYKELFHNGTIRGIDQELPFETTENFEKEIENNLKENADRTNLEVEMEILDFTVYQTDPWNIRFTLIMDLTIEDRAGAASWKKSHFSSSLRSRVC
jgi:hypothetical protein